MNKLNVLQNLKDIQLPTPVSMWPKAPGWYLLVLLCIAVVILLTFYLFRWWLKYRRKKLALRQLHKAQDIATISTLVRRVALAKFHREQVASLQGNQWLQFLDKTSNSNRFTQGIGRCLASVPYQQKIEIDVNLLKPTIATWIKRVI